MAYNKFFASLVGAIIAFVGMVTGQDFGLPEGVLETVGALAASLLVFVIPNIDEKGNNAANRVDGVIDDLRDFVNNLPNRE